MHPIFVEELMQIYIYIDGTLYDFKCTKKERYVWKDVAQILGYYLLSSRITDGWYDGISM